MAMCMRYVELKIVKAYSRAAWVSLLSRPRKPTIPSSKPKDLNKKMEVQYWQKIQKICLAGRKIATFQEFKERMRDVQFLDGNLS